MNSKARIEMYFYVSIFKINLYTTFPEVFLSILRKSRQSTSNK